MISLTKVLCYIKERINYALIFEKEPLMIRWIQWLSAIVICARRYYYQTLASTLPFLELQDFKT